LFEKPLRILLREIYYLQTYYITVIINNAVSFYFFQICISFFSDKERPLLGPTFSLATTYLTYALMPIRLKDALLAGTVLALTQVILLIYVGHLYAISDVSMIYCSFVETLSAAGETNSRRGWGQINQVGGIKQRNELNSDWIIQETKPQTRFN
jgi:uncharacterized membrane protein YhaH (DUF805 family)